ncbi:MAG: aldehyde ferredoxin oxidoreductase N-terminal domain-containing protein [Candidatus Hodarchaeales archaeon]|jgi:aldehyde:ferredoxin oxidoreductase
MWKPELLKFDLTEEKILPKERVEERIVENFLGGRGISVYLGYHSIPTDTSPRGPENSVIFGTGLFTGTNFPSSGTVNATYKSPHTNTLCTSVATGKFGASLKNMGIDFFQINGRAKKPYYILIDEFADVTLEDAEPFWKKNIIETDSLLRKKYGNEASIASIGLSAVNQVTYAGVSVDREHYFQRGGLGAVLASKNIKAIVISDPPKLIQLKSETIDFLQQINQLVNNESWSRMLKSRGTFSLIFSIIQNNLLPAKNCSRLLHLAPDKINAFSGYNKALKCWQCSIGCHRALYEDFVALGPNLKIVDLNEIQTAIELCNSEALDPLSTGAALASLYNIQEDRRKLLDIHLGFSWGDPTIYSLIQKVILKEGIGDQIARGESFFYQQTDEPAPLIKNQIPGMYYYPNITGMSIAAATSPYGSSNPRSNFMIFPEILGIPFKLNQKSNKGQIRTLILLENLIAVFDSLVLCTRYLPLFLQVKKGISRFSSQIRNVIFQYIPNPLIGNFGLKLEILIPLLRELYNEQLTFGKLFEIGNRITLLERLFNTRMGMTSAEDEFPHFLAKRPDFFKIQKVLRNEYYQKKGLSPTGLVRKKTLEKSGLIGLISL